jgi:adenine-specific DNA-methyltransferase
MTYEINRTELVWPGKYDLDGNLNVTPAVTLPFQIIERVNETRAAREKRENRMATLFDIWEENSKGSNQQGEWRNKLIWGDNKLVMESLLENYANKIDLIYIDPPFDVGADFSLEISIGDESIVKERSLIEEVAYRDTWGKGKDSYVPMIQERLRLIYSLLSPTGTLVVHSGIQVNHHIRMLAEEIFSSQNVIDEIIWAYGSASGGRAAGNKVIKVHEYLLVCAKNRENFTYNKQYTPYSEKYVKDWFKHTDENGRIYQRRQRGRDENGDAVWEKQYLDESPGVALTSVWTDILQVYADPRAYKAGVSSELTGYPTQKPKALLERIVKSFSNEGDLVADFFCGSGTTMAVAEQLNRRWIGSDIGRFAIHTTRKRFLDMEGCTPFEILNLGFYERQYWSNISFGEDFDGDGHVSLLEYVAFILKLYGANAISGGVQLHGKRNNAFVHVGSVTSPVTIQEIEETVAECAAMKGAELHILGWEWEMGLIDTLTVFAQSKGVKLLALQIPREVMEAEAARKGQIKFFELSYLEASIEKVKEEREFVCVLEDFVIPNPELVPDEVRGKVKDWSDYVDYWAVDWDFQNDTFMPSWMDYRTKQDRSLERKSGKHSFDKPGVYKIMIKVVDIFGNDTTKIITHKVK